MASLRYALGRRFRHRPDESGSHGPRESESWSYPTAGSTLRLELWRVGRPVVAFGLLVPIGPIPALAARIIVKQPSTEVLPAGGKTICQNNPIKQQAQKLRNV